MPRNCNEVCDIGGFPNCSEERLVEIWEQCQSGEIEWDDEWFRAFLEEYFKRGLSITIDLRKGRLNFDVSEDDLRLFEQGSLEPWVRPDRSREDYSYILAYGQSFAGYQFVEQRGIDLDMLANGCLNDYRKTGKWEGDFVSLRCCLFYELRRQHHIGLYESNWREIQSLFKAVCAAFESEAPFLN